MTKIGLVYFSNTDVTGQLMLAAETELKKCAQVITYRITGTDIINGRFRNDELFERLHVCNAIIFGSPTYMGGVSAQFKAFADATSDFWSDQTWSGKVASGITSGTSLNGDQSSTLNYFGVLASQHGMIWLGLDAPFSDLTKGINRLGCQLGVTACSPDGKVDEADLRSARYLANRVFKFASRINDIT